MKYLSLFSGIGGFELGIQQAYETIESNRQQQENSEISGSSDSSTSQSQQSDKSEKRRNYTCIGYSEINKYAIQIYEKHFKHKNWGDITKIKASELPDFDLICGGFPCQSFSIAGKRGGFDDTRGTLFFDIARIIRAKRPRLLFLENVKGLLSHDGGRTFDTIIRTLDGLGYDLQWQVLNSKNFGVPQNRERVFIIGHLRGTSRPKVFPIGESSGLDVEPKRPVANTLKVEDANGYRTGAYVAEPEFLTSKRIRRLTPTECERLQGFPDGWTRGVSDTQRYKTLGNAVTVNVIKEIAQNLIH